MSLSGVPGVLRDCRQGAESGPSWHGTTQNGQTLGRRRLRGVQERSETDRDGETKEGLEEGDPTTLCLPSPDTDLPSTVGGNRTTRIRSWRRRGGGEWDGPVRGEQSH